MKIPRNLARLQSEYNIFNHINPLTMNGDAKGPLAGIIAAIKDNIATKDEPTTCSSRMLSNYQSPFDATVVSKLRANGAQIIGKTNMDEFGMGSMGSHSYFGPCYNPLFPSRQKVNMGGSSSGSAAAVSSGLVDFALGTDTGGSVRLPSSYGGAIGFKPSYGRISRFGVVDFAQSLDTVGIISKDVSTLCKVFKVLDCEDERDPTCLTKDLRDKIDTNFQTKYKIGIPKEFVQDNVSDEIHENFLQFVSKLMDSGCEIYAVSVPSLEFSLPVYYTIATAEAASNLSRYDGIRYGIRDNDGMTRDNFGPEVRSRIIVGNYTLCSEKFEEYFIKAEKLRVELINSFDSIFRLRNILTDNEDNLNDGIDMILCPTTKNLPTETPQKWDNPVNEYLNDFFTIPMSLAGLPTISIPFVSNEPRGSVQICTQYGYDTMLLNFIKSCI
ncbi:hypothetical protein KAFR_0I02500 [Kazachstania africana CBS 2517]|uniref:Glutamyl-tRNA(Gln) amidotransferase subunit A, mitochondrial n=1 Tax=Kazachstania africana (strain ATCC 22294 / BCRC 22015 / CBS 2517 / CECT 1963 / NBRC 1671 / NRRL Y-8276) TaxID=1071382 RepID=H2B079_KAZAF|nr:hypothetical protein KAFR_0I02500 [Kazachstania africana CBS 2517]CCF60029.1 hypothetical protein KAFR_0I02500 [Kazachstania africana CBS 2517]